MTSQRHSAAPEATPTARDIPDEILDAVREAVMAVGVRRTTLTDVARRAGVSRMTLYRLVPDVETLLLGLMTREFGALLSAVEDGAARRRTARARLVAMTVDLAARLPADPLFCRIVDVDPELLLPYVTDRVGSTQRLALGRIRRIVTEGQADGSVRRGPVEVMAMAYLLTVTPWILSARLLDEVGAAEALRELERGMDGWLKP